MSVAVKTASPQPTVAVVGAGLMGHGIAQAFMTAGWETTVWDNDPDVLATLGDRIARNLAEVGSALPVTVTVGQSLESSIAPVGLIVEALPEDLAVKRAFLEVADEVNPDAILATNTSVLRITDISEASSRAGRVVGTHWWNPPHLIRLVEVVAGERTSMTTRDQVVDVLKSLGKIPVTLSQDVPGFVGNRLQFALWREAMAIVERGIADAATVDWIVRETFGRRLPVMGPLENADFIGLDLTESIMSYILPALEVNAEPPGVLTSATARGDLGAKTGSGFHTWKAGDRAAVAQRLTRHLLRSATTTAEADQEGPAGG